MFWDILAIIVAVILFLLGILGTIVPLLPGAPMIWTGMLIYGLIAGFEGLPFSFFLMQGILALAVMGVDYLMTFLGTHFFGGSRAAFWGAALGLFLGLIFFNVPGLLIGTFVGAIAGELMIKNDFQQAAYSGIGALVGFLGGIPFKLFLEVIMITWFVLAIL